MVIIIVKISVSYFKKILASFKKWSLQIDFWKDARFNGDFADVMVAPSVLKKVEKELRDSDFKFVVTIPDVQKYVHLPTLLTDTF